MRAIETIRTDLISSLKSRIKPSFGVFFFSIFFKVALRIMKQAISEAEEIVLVTLKLEEAVN